MKMSKNNKRYYFQFRCTACEEQYDQDCIIMHDKNSKNCTRPKYCPWDAADAKWERIDE